MTPDHTPMTAAILDEIAAHADDATTPEQYAQVVLDVHNLVAEAKRLNARITEPEADRDERRIALHVALAERDRARRIARRQHQRIRRAELAGILGHDRHEMLPDWLTEADNTEEPTP